jgi:hypothetical protein
MGEMDKQKYEYYCINGAKWDGTRYKGCDFDVDEFDYLGEDGWELVGFQENDAWFKRKRLPAEKEG